MKKLITTLFVLALGIGGITTISGCGESNTDINAITREQGSGTRDAFIELFGIQEKTAAGDKIDHTTSEAAIAKSTAEVLTKVAGDEDSIGYISLGSLNDTVKALAIDGTNPSVATVKDGSYKISRPFNVIVPEGKYSEKIQDFMDFIASSVAQSVIESEGYISNSTSETKAFKTKGTKGSITICGSSSVSPLMEKLIEEYNKINPELTINLNTSDSTTGIQDVTNKRGDIGMASRELKDEETGLVSVQIATDGLAVIVNKDSKTSGLTSTQVKDIFTGSVKTWEELIA